MAKKKINWTASQRQAIEARGGNVLVAASAGAGKTAVLVERCIELASDPVAPIDIDRLLVVTFTEAAAAEMRTRIGEALRRRIENGPSGGRLRRQLILLDRASISTLHSYAFRTLQEHFFHLGLDPNVSVMDQEETDLLRAEVLDQVFESLYLDETEAGERFRRLVGRYGRNSDDQPVRRAVLELSQFMRSLPWPEHWRERVLASYGQRFSQTSGVPPSGEEESRLQPGLQTAAERFEDWRVWYSPFVEALEKDLKRVAAQARAAARWAYDSDPVLQPYEGHFESVAGALEGLNARLANDGFDGAQPAVADYKYPKIPTVRGIDESLREAAKARNDTIREFFREKIQRGWCALSGGQWVMTLRSTRPFVDALFEVAARFDEACSEAKRERGNVDFQDLERFCFDLLVDREVSSPERLAPSAAAREIRDRFEAVLVDEYQDISPLQDAILHLSSRQDESHRAPNLFMVGDVKQSIYRFRLAEPNIFLDKFRIYRPDAAAGAARRIDLSENHRSRSGLLSAINAAFRLIMIPEVGRIAYDDSAELRGGFDFPADVPADCPPPTAGIPVEAHFFDRAGQSAAASGETEEAPEADEKAEPQLPDDATELEQIEIEAMWIARRIADMVHTSEFSIWDRSEQRYRAVAFRDVAILLQTAAYKADLFVRVLRQMGVAAYTESSGGYLRASEIQDVLSFLRILDNPHQNVAAAAVLRSPLAGLCEDDLARIRIHRRNDDFFSAVAAYAAEGRDEPLRKRLAEFLDRLDRWRTLARRGPLAQALWTIYDETGYLDYVTGMNDGAQRRANLIGLYDRARQFDEFSRRGLWRFLEFIRRLQETEGELAAPSAISEAENVVRVMTIHKSKGLEFPVVFLPDAGKPWNFENARGDLVMDREKGVALRQVDTERAVKCSTAAHLVVARSGQREMLAEQLRLLYVAMTRAREKLILCGSVHLDSAQQEWRNNAGNAGNGAVPLDADTIGSAQCFADWIGPALARLGHVAEQERPVAFFTTGQAFVVHWHRADEWQGWKRTGRERLAESEPLRKIATMQPVGPPPHDRALVAQLMERLRWRYGRLPLTEVRGKVSVTELKRRFEAAHESDERPSSIFAASMNRRPAFIAEENDRAAPLTATEIGTAFHTVLRHLDLTKPPAAGSIGQQIAAMTTRGILTNAEAAVVEVAFIVRFLDSAIGQEMRRDSDRVRRELPFSLAVPADELTLLGRQSEESPFSGSIHPPSATRDPKSEMEFVLVQGIIDCLIERPDGFLLVDYKTDRVNAEDAAARADSYRTQITFYSRAVETVFRRPVIRRSLYFLYPGTTVDV